MSRKKVVFIIVEGLSDEGALGVPLVHFFKDDSVHVHVVHYDITTEKGNSAKNIVNKVCEPIKKYAKEYHLSSGDFLRIIHITDTDGMYIPNSSIIADASLDEYVYEDDGIHTKDVEGAIARNKQKRECVLTLRRTNHIWKIPYKLYFMSCNLDHVLHNERNSTNEEKEQNALAFAKKYEEPETTDEFVRFLCESDFSVMKPYADGWSFIEDGMNSVKRYTNIGLALS